MNKNIHTMLEMLIFIYWNLEKDWNWFEAGRIYPVALPQTQSQIRPRQPEKKLKILTLWTPGWQRRRDGKEVENIVKELIE